MKNPEPPSHRAVLLPSILWLIIFALFVPLAWSQTSLTKIGQLDLSVGGLAASVTPAQPQIPKNTATGVQIVVTLNGQVLDANTVAQYLGGSFEVVGELSGPGLPQTIDVPQTPDANPLILDLPALNTDGNYTLSNLRLIVNGNNALDLTPSTVTVKVFDQVLVTSVQTAPLTLDQIQAMGVVLDSSDYTGFQFTIGLQLSSGVVNVSFPVVFDHNGVQVPLPLNPPGPASLNGVTVPIPLIVPVLMTGADGTPLPNVELPGGGGSGPIRIPSILVIPGNVGYLKQFFSAKLYVTNATPNGANLVVHDVTAQIVLPPGPDGLTTEPDDPLLLPNLTSGPEPDTLPVLAPGPDGTPSVGALNAGQTGEADFVVVANKEGFYNVNFDINATLDGLATGSLAIKGTASGGLLVRNPYFNMTFAVPGVVRSGENFTLFATVTNTSQAIANNVTVSIDSGSLSGAVLTSGQPPAIPTLNPGDSAELEFQFQALRTGQVVADYLNFDTSNGTTGNLLFTLGVDPRGVPLSPDTLVLPSSVDKLPPDVVSAAMRVLGEAWSAATAPAGTLPAGVTPISTAAVTQKALALAEAGLRVTLGQPVSNAVRDLATDFWGGSPLDPGFDQLLRQSPAGQGLASAIGANLAQAMSQSGGAVAYEQQFGQLGASGPNFLSFAVGNGSSGAPVTVTLTDGSGNQMSSSAPGGAIPGGVLLPLANSGAAPVLGIVTAPTASPYTLLLTPQSSGTTDLSLSIPSGSGTVVRAQASGVPTVAGQPMRIVADFSNPNNLILQTDTNGDGSFATSTALTTTILAPSGPTLTSASVIGPDTVSQAGYFGLNLALLFDRIVDPTTAATASNYQIPSNSVLTASRQLSGRIVFANLSQPEGPYVPTTVAESGVADQRGAVGLAATVNLQSLLVDSGAVVSGRVYNADGSAATNATVIYSAVAPPDAPCLGGSTFDVAAVPVNPQGVYQFRYVLGGQCEYPFTITTQDPVTGDLRQVSAHVEGPGQQIVLDLSMLGLGSVTGVVTDLSGNPVADAKVVAVSVTDPQVGGSTYTNGSGQYTINSIPVGPVNISAAAGINGGAAAGNIARAGTAAVVNVTLNSGTVQVSGTVTKLQNGVITPLPGLYVAYYLASNPLSPVAVGVAQTAVDGSYVLSGMPAGPYQIQVYLDTSDGAQASGVATAGAALEVPLVITIKSTATVTGTVFLPNGTPAAGAVVFPQNSSSGALTNPDGTFSLAVPVQTGQQQISARTEDGLRSGSAIVTANAATVFSGVNITLSGLGTAVFTVLDANGKPLAGQTVNLFPGSSPVNPCGSDQQQTDANGNATFTGLSVGKIPANAEIGQDQASGSANITQDGATGYGILQFHGSGTVKGSVIDPQNHPVLGAQIALTSLTLDYASCTLVSTVTQSVPTDVTGAFQFKGVTAGPVGVTASQSFYPTSVGQKGTLANDGTQTFNLQLVNTTAGVLSGTVFLPDGVTPAGAGVQVTANGPLPNVTVSTDSSGNYKFGKIFPQGAYTLNASDPVSGGTTQMVVDLNAGQDMTQNLRLLGTGTVNVTVVDGAGNPVGSAYVSLDEVNYPNQSFDQSLDASGQGVASFQNIFEGPFGVSAIDSVGRSGRASGVLPQGITSVNVQVQLTTTGTVAGHFYMPDGVTAIPNATVNLTEYGRAIGSTTTAATGDIGSFQFNYVPAGALQLNAQDPLTGRTGIAAGSITTQGQSLTLNINAEGLDTVQGLVTSNGVPEPGATVTIVSGKFQATTTADSNGNYLVTGVPEGVVTATASLGNNQYTYQGNDFLTGTASRPINGDSQTFELDVALRGSGSVSGQIVQADGVTPATPSQVTINVGGTGGGAESTTTDAQGNFSFAIVPAGSGTISVQVLGSLDQGTSAVTIGVGSNATVTIKLNGIGAISGTALNSSGQPTAGTVYVTGTGPFPYNYTVSAGADGKFSLPQVLAGPFTAQLSANIDGFTLYGNATGTVAPAQTSNVTVEVQPSGTISGIVLRPDGQTPAIGANVTISVVGGNQGISQTIQAQNDGSFTATGVPLGSFTVSLNDPITNGLGLVTGQTLSMNGQDDNVGTIVLNNTALAVVSTNPLNNAMNVGLTQPITVVFNDALNGTGGIYVTAANEGSLPLAATLSSDQSTVTLSGPLPNAATLTLNITSAVRDSLGRALQQPETIIFTTTDTQPPAVASISPASGVIQVPVSTPVVVTFNKTIQLSNIAGIVTLQGPAGVVAGTAVLGGQNSNVLTFTPSTALLVNAIYSVSVNGAIGLDDVQQTAAFTSTFLTPDTIPPTLQLVSPAPGSWANTSRPTINISLSDNLTGPQASTAQLAIDGKAVSPTASSSSMQFTPSAALADGQHAVTASVQDLAGNTGTLSASFGIDTVPPSQPVISGITPGEVLKGTIPLSASATDSESGVARINIYANGSLVAALLAPGFSGNFNTATLADGSYTITAIAVDNAGNSSSVSAPVQVYISNIPLTVTISSPANGAQFGSQVTVTATTSKPPAQVLFALGSQTFTVTSSPYRATFSLVNVPEGQQTITATATAVDGLQASASVTIVVDHTPPSVNPVLIAANPPVNGISVVRGLPGAVGDLAQIAITDTNNHAVASAGAASDGSFSTSISGAVGDVLSLVATDAAGNSSNPITFKIPQTAPLPQVSQVQPANGTTGVALNTDVVVRFTQPVAATSVVPGTLTLLNGSASVAGSVSLSNDSLSLTFAPSRNLAASTTFTVVVQDVANGQTSPLFTSSFTTGTTSSIVAPTIMASSPPTGSTGVPINAPVQVQFSEAMNPATLTPQNFVVFDQQTRLNVPGMIQVDPTGVTAAFVPEPPYGIGHTISVTLTANIKDNFGNALTGSGTSFSFTTGFGPDNQGPNLLGTSPAVGMTGVPLNSLVVAEFDSPLDVVTASQGFQVQLNGTAIAGGTALSDSNKRITFTPLGGLAANSTYTIAITSQITDIAGNPVANPGIFTFSTSATTDTSIPRVNTVSPFGGATGVPTNVVVQVQFSKRIDPFTVNGSTFYLYPQDTDVLVPGSIVVSADGLTATLTPAAPLQTGTTYQVWVTNGITDLEGQALSTFTPSFTTGLGTATSGPVVVSVSPQSGAVGVPVNARVDVLMSVPVEAASVGSSAITVSAGGTAVAGTITPSSNRMTVTFVPSSLLAVSTVYTVTVAGMTDNAGNVMAPFTSSFTTGSSGTANTTKPTATVSPANGATGVSVNSSIVLTFNEAVDPTTVNNGTIPISVSGYSGVLAGSYTVNGAVVTFTPESPLPGSATINIFMYANAVLDASGNGSNQFSSSFTTAGVADTTAPQVVMVTPGNGTTAVGLNAVVTLTFSESLNPSTVNTSNFGLFANGSELSVSLSRSADNTTVTLSATLPAATTVTVVVTSGVTDLSGNALGNFESSFTTGTADTTHASVVTQRPGNGATGVPLNESVVLYLSEAMNTATLPGALHISQNGVLVSGTVQVTDNGQTIQFTPSSPWQNGALIQVFMDTTALDTDGNSLSAYQGSFTTVANTSTVVPAVVNTSPAASSSGVPTNVVIDVGFNETLSPATVNGTNVYLTQGFSTVVPSTGSLIGGGTVIQIVPSAPLTANTLYYYHITNGVLGTNGLAFPSNYWNFTTGSGTDTVVPTIVSVSPSNGSTNVGDNIEVHVVFSKPVNPLTVSATSIQLTGGGTTEVPDSISFSNNNQSVVLVSHGPLPDNTVMTISISGVTDLAGNAVAPQTMQFTTGTGPDLTAPAVVSENPYNGETNVPLNAPVILQANEPIDPGSVNSNTFFVQDDTTGQEVGGSYSVSADGQTISFVPGAPLAVSRTYSVFWVNRGITDLAGNLLTNTVLSNYNFTTGTAANTTAPQVVGVSPANGLTGVPINAQVVIEFNEPVDGATLSGVALSGGSGTVNVSKALSNANQTLTLIPSLPLATSTTYAVTIAGIQDVAGNTEPSPVTSTFSTGSGATLASPSILSVSPGNGQTGFPTNAVVQVAFSNPMDPLSFTSTTFRVYATSGGATVAGTTTLSPDGTIATFTPSSALAVTTAYTVSITNGVTDVSGQPMGNFTSSFTTGTGPTSAVSTLDTSNPLSTNLAGLFPMNEGIGSADVNLVDGGLATFTGVNPPQWNVLDPSIVFSGGNSGNSYLYAGADLIFDQLPTNRITIVARVYVNSATASSGVCEKNDSNTKDSGFVFGWDTTGALRLTVEKSTANMRVATAGHVVPIAQWVQVAFTWDGTVGTASAAHLFINGVEQPKASSSDGSGTLGYANATYQPFRIGNASFDFPGSLNGKMAYLAVYKGRILSTTEMSQLDAKLPIK